MKKLLHRYRAPLCAFFAATLCLLATHPALAQAVTIDLDSNDATMTGRMIQFMLLTTVLTLAPSILVMTTAFTRIVIVLSIARRAIATQTAPPNTVMVGLALFLTFFVMEPTLQQSWTDGVKPLIAEEVSPEEGIKLAAAPFHKFMMSHVRPKDLDLFMDLAKAEPAEKAEDVPYSALIPAFIISECNRAFQMGFLIYIPFLVIDMVIASVLMSMGMMMLPPVMLSMPFKLIFFVLIDGWYLLTGSLVQSFGG